MLYWTAFMLGVAGSLHCAGMCGPLLLALPAGPSRGRFLVGRLAYNGGRLLTYAGIGVLFGWLGQTFAMAGFQRWISIAAGAAILSGVLTSARFAMSGPFQSIVAGVKSGLGGLLRRPGVSAQFGFGLLNGLLPCGLVYAAAAGAAAAGSVLDGVGYMVAFGLGTVPMMLTLAVAGQQFPPAVRFRFQRLTPVCVGIVGALLILRGLSLGIPYLSPVLTECARCH